MPFSKDVEAACGRKRKVLQEEEPAGPRQSILGRDSFGQDGAEGTCEDRPEKEAGQVGMPPLVMAELLQDELSWGFEEV